MNANENPTDNNESVVSSIIGDEGVQRSAIAVGVSVLVAVARHYLFGKAS